jgi:hypothetical protein
MCSQDLNLVQLPKYLDLKAPTFGMPMRFSKPIMILVVEFCLQRINQMAPVSGVISQESQLSSKLHFLWGTEGSWKGH